MSVAQHLAANAVVEQFAAALVRYEDEISRIASGPMDPDLYHQIGLRMDEMRMYASTLQALSVPWVEVLIRHFELMHGLWQQTRELRTRDEVSLLLAAQLESIRVLRLRCLALSPAAAPR